MSVAAGINAIIKANTLQFPLTLTVRTLGVDGEFHFRTATAESLQDVVDIATVRAAGDLGVQITCDAIILFPPGFNPSPHRFRLHLPDTL